MARVRMFVLAVGTRRNYYYHVQSDRLEKSIILLKQFFKRSTSRIFTTISDEFSQKLRHGFIGIHSVHSPWELN